MRDFVCFMIILFFVCTLVSCPNDQNYLEISYELFMNTLNYHKDNINMLRCLVVRI